MVNIGAIDYAMYAGGLPSVFRALELNEIYKTQDYEKFVHRLYKDIDAIIFQFQANPQKRNGDSEDRLTEEFVTNLNTLGYSASHDTSSGGHVDITVKLGLSDLSWIGEAKKDKEFREGFMQLCDRYKPASGNFNHNHAGMLLYFSGGADIITLKDRWEEKVKEFSEYEGIRTSACNLKGCTAFFSAHKHSVSGIDFNVRHMHVALHFDPTDRSGRATKARRKRKTAIAKTSKAPS
nr:hypothetical protein [uncultured Undibacterium sp.]